MMPTPMTPEQANDAKGQQGGVLAALPRTRPQRTSARRAAARARVQSETATAAPGKRAAAKPATKAKANARKKPAKQTTVKQTRTKQTGTERKSPKTQAARDGARARGGARPVRPSRSRQGPPQAEQMAPKQGYEPEEEIELGNTVHPPSGGELIESLADIFGELASAGAGAGGRLLRDALSIFRRP